MECLVSAWDPGVHGSAFSLWRNGILIRVGLTENGGLTPWMPSSGMPPEWVDVAVVELPTIYGTRTQKGDQKNVRDLIAAAAALCARLPARAIRLAEPREWKGQVPKEVHHPRILKKLTEDELKLLKSLTKKRKDIMDAIGLGLWFLGRM